MNLRTAAKPAIWLFWHPHQRLWNWELVHGIQRLVPTTRLRRLLVTSLVGLDTLLLAWRVALRRMRLVGIGKLLAKAQTGEEVPVLYLDIGTHKEAEELRWIAESVLPRHCRRFEAIGFEASRASFESARQRLASLTPVRLVHTALCGELPDGGKIRLYHDDGNGLGDSLYRKTASYEAVDAIRLSDWLREHELQPDSHICLLRMNIEGAEFDVLDDLVRNDMSRHVDGYYGMWDDLSKIDIERDRDFRGYLARNGIVPVTFNGRDMKWPARMRCIEYDIETSLLAGEKKRSSSI